MRRLTIITIAIALHANLRAQTLNDYIRIATENNPGIKGAYSEFEASMQQVAQVNALPDPTLSFGVFISPVETRVGPQRARVSLTQMFPWFGTLKAKEQVASLAAEAKYQHFLDMKSKVHLDVKNSYYPIYELREQIKWQEENLSILNIYKKLATTSFSNAKGALVDIIRADIIIDDMETNIQILKNKLHPLQIEFNRKLNRPDDSEIKVQGSLSLINGAEFSRDSLGQIAIIDRFNTQIEIASASEELARKQGAPKLGVGVDYMIVGQRSDISIADNGKNAFMPMVSVSLPIFRKKYKAAIKESRYQRKAFEFQKEEFINGLTSAFENSQYEMDRAKLQYELFGQQIIKTKQAIDLLYSSYGNSGQNFEEVLRMQQQLLKYKMAKSTAIKNYYMAHAKLAYLTTKVE